MATYQPAKSLPCKFTPAGGSIQTILVTELEWTESVDTADVTDTGAGGVQQLVATIGRGEGRMKGFLDTAAPFWASTVGIYAGVNGVLRDHVTASLYYAVPCMITAVHVLRPVGGVVEFEGSFKLNGIAGSYALPS